MNLIQLKTECQDCGGDACIYQSGNRAVIIIEFLEETPFTCSCGAETYLDIEKRTEGSNA